MSKKEEFDFDDDFGLGDSLDFGSTDVHDNQKQSGRAPILDTGLEFKSDLINNITDPENIREATRQILPKGYNTAWDAADTVATTGRDLYDSATKELGPLIADTKVIARRLTPRLRSIMPDSIVDKIDKALEPEEASGGREQIDPNEAAIQSSLGDIFKAQAEQTEAKDQSDVVQNTVDSMVSTERFKNTTEQLNAIIGRLDRQVSYQDQIAQKYQKQSLELQFRHFFVARDLFELTKLNNANELELLQRITHNTGLPDFQKTHLSEDWKAFAQEKLMGKAHSAIGNSQLAEWGSNFTKNMTTEVMDAVSSFGSQAGMLTGVLGQIVKDPNEPEDEFSGPNRGIKGLISESVAGSLANKLRKAGGDKVGAWIEGNDKAMTASNLLQSMLGNFPQLMNEIKESDLADFGIEDKGAAKGIYKTLKMMTRWNPTMTSGEDVLSNLHDDATDVVPWDVLQRRTLIEIIPGYLSRQLQQLEILATGKKDTERLVYSTKSESYVPLSSAARQAVKAVHSDKKLDELSTNFLDKINDLDGDQRLSDGARKALFERLLDDAKVGKTLNPARYIKPETFAREGQSNAIQDELAHFFRKQFDVLEGSDQVNLMSRSVSGKVRDFTTLASGLSDDVQDYQSAINKYSGTGEKDILRAAGIIGKDKGKDVFNSDNLRARQNNSFMRALQKEREENKPELPDGNMGPDAPPELVFKLKNQNRSLISDTPSEDTRVKTYTEDKAFSVPRSIAGHTQVPRLSDEYINSTLQQSPTATIQQTQGIMPKVFPMPVEQMAIVSSPLEQLVISDNQKRDILEDLNSSVHLIGESVAGILVELKEGINIGGEGGTRISIDGGEGVKKFLNKSKSGFGKIFRGIGRANMAGFNLAKKPFELAGNVYAGAKSGLKSALGFGGDIYVKGRKQAAMTHAKLENGDYHLLDGGAVIKRLSDITGPVVDENGNIVISLEDIKKGFHDNFGKNLVIRGVEWIIKAPFKALSMLYPSPANMLGGVWKTLKSTRSQILTFVNRIKDVYVKGDDVPALYAHKLTAGEYYLKDDISKRVKSVDDITGAVVDELGNVVLSAEDINKGLVDAQGNPFKTVGLVGLALSAGSKVFGGVKKIAKGAWDKVKSIHKGMTGVFSSALGIITGRLKKAAQRAQGIEFDNVDLYAKTVNIYSDKDGTPTQPIIGQPTPKVAPATPESEDPDSVSTIPNPELAVKNAYKSAKDAVNLSFGKAKAKHDAYLEKVAEREDHSKTEVLKEIAGTKAKSVWNLLPKSFRDKADKKRKDLNDKVSETIKNKLTELTGKDWETLSSTLSPKEIKALIKQSKEGDKEGLEERLGIIGSLGTDIKGKIKDKMFNMLPESLQDRLTKPKEEKEKESPISKLTAMISKRFPEKKKVSGDSDGDGDRDNGWRDMLSRKKKVPLTEKEKDAKEEKKDGSMGLGIFAGLIAWLAPKFAGFGAMFKSLLTIFKMKKAADIVSDATNGFDLPDSESGETDHSKRKRGESRSDYRKRMKHSGMRRKSHGFGRSAMKFGGAAVLGNLTGATDFMDGASTSVVSGLTGMSKDEVNGSVTGQVLNMGAQTAMMAGAEKVVTTGARLALPAATTALAAITGVGVVTIAAAGAAVAAAGVGAYYGYKYFSRRSTPEPIELLRYYQYGIDPTDAQQLVAIRYFEGEIDSDYVTQDNRGIAKVSTDPYVLLSKYYDDFGLSGKDEQQNRSWIQWYTQRFLPVYLTSKSQAYMVAPDDSIDLLDIDDELDDKLKVDYAKRTIYAPDGNYGGALPYAMPYSPFPDKQLSVGYGNINKQLNVIIKKFGNAAQQGTLNLKSGKPVGVEDKEQNQNDVNNLETNIKKFSVADELKKQANKQPSSYLTFKSNKPSTSGVSSSIQPYGSLKELNRITTEALTNKPSDVGSKVSAFASPADFVKRMLPFAQAPAAMIGVDPAFLIAQAAQETGWGKRIIAEQGKSSHNLFNIKADRRWNGPAMQCLTTEFYNGSPKKEYHPFRAYNDFEQSFADYVQFLYKNPRYSDPAKGNALGNTDDPFEFAAALQKAGYATDPAYANNLMGVYRGVQKRLPDGYALDGKKIPADANTDAGVTPMDSSAAPDSTQKGSDAVATVLDNKASKRNPVGANTVLKLADKDKADKVSAARTKEEVKAIPAKVTKINKLPTAAQLGLTRPAEEIAKDKVRLARLAKLAKTYTKAAKEAEESGDKTRAAMFNNGASDINKHLSTVTKWEVDNKVIPAPPVSNPVSYAPKVFAPAQPSPLVDAQQSVLGRAAQMSVTPEDRNREITQSQVTRTMGQQQLATAHYNEAKRAADTLDKILESVDMLKKDLYLRGGRDGVVRDVVHTQSTTLMKDERRPHEIVMTQQQQARQRSTNTEVNVPVSMMK